jgi:hypothetical protein
MNQRGKKLQPKLSLDMPFDEALARFAAVSPTELTEAIRRSKESEAPSNDPPPRPKVRRKRH